MAGEATAAKPGGFLIQWTLLFGLENALLFSEPPQSILNTPIVLRALINVLALRSALSSNQDEPFIMEKWFRDLGVEEVREREEFMKNMFSKLILCVRFLG